MSRRCATVIGLLLAAALVLPACNKGKDGVPTKTYDSPQAVFEAAVAAQEKEDWPEFMGCLTEDARDAYALNMVKNGLFAKENAELEKEKGKELIKAIDDVMKKHGLSEETLNKEPPAPAAGEDQRAAIKEFLAPIKDKPAFVADMAAVMKKKGERSALVGGVLKDIKVEGDKATATMKRTFSKVYEQPIEFRKVHGGWKMELPGDLEEVVPK